VSPRGLTQFTAVSFDRDLAMRKAIILGVFSALGVSLLLAMPALAGGLTVYGGKIESPVAPGQTYTYTMKVENSSDQPMDISAEVKGYGTSDSSDFVVLEPEDDQSPYSARGMLAVTPNSFKLEPSASQVITVEAKIPSAVGDGGRYAIVLIHTTAGGQAVATISAVAARVLLANTSSTLSHSSEITTIHWAAETPTEVSVTVANKGNHHYKPHITADLMSGTSVLATANFDAQWPLIPTYERQFNLSFAPANPLPAGNYQVSVQVADDSGKVVSRTSSSLQL
jgi:P pilus assembly chaperone PapD